MSVINPTLSLAAETIISSDGSNLHANRHNRNFGLGPTLYNAHISLRRGGSLVGFT